MKYGIAECQECGLVHRIRFQDRDKRPGDMLSECGTVIASRKGHNWRKCQGRIVFVGYVELKKEP